MPKITLPIRGSYSFLKNLDANTQDITLRSGYTIPYIVNALTNSLYTDAGDQTLGLATYPADAEIVGFLSAAPISMSFDISATEPMLIADGKSHDSLLGLKIEGVPVFQRFSDNTNNIFGIGIESASAALVRKTILSDIDSGVLTDIDGQSLYDLTYITIE